MLCVECMKHIFTDYNTPGIIVGVCMASAARLLVELEARTIAHDKETWLVWLQQERHTFIEQVTC